MREANIRQSRSGHRRAVTAGEKLTQFCGFALAISELT